jgi:diguanylate cyclase (GGDEF)-like protein
MPNENLGFSRELHDKLAAIDRRDWQLWVVMLIILAILSVGLLLVFYPAVFLGQTAFTIETHIPAEGALGILLLVLGSIVYFIWREIGVKKIRQYSMNAVVQYQIDSAPAFLDPVTQVFTHTALHTLISKEVKRAERKQTVLTVLYANVESLKALNARFGHLKSDLVLAEVAAILKQSVRGCDYVIRIGAQEFLVVLVDTDSLGAEAVNRRIESRVANWNETGLVQHFSLVINIGLATFDGSRPLDEIIADAKMHPAVT